MNAFALALQKADSKQSVSKMDEWEAKALGTTVEKFRKAKQGFIDTYEIARVHTMEYGYRMPKYKRSGFKACGNY